MFRARYLIFVPFLLLLLLCTSTIRAAEASGCVPLYVSNPAGAIDELRMSDGVLFERMFAPAPICTPSRGCLLSGRYPLANGLVGKNMVRRL